VAITCAVLYANYHLPQVRQVVTLKSWGEIEAAVKGRDPEAWRDVEGHLALWEAKHRTHGGDRSKPSDTGVARDDESARGIRRRLVKRAQAGDLYGVPHQTLNDKLARLESTTDRVRSLVDSEPEAVFGRDA